MSRSMSRRQLLMAAAICSGLGPAVAMTTSACSPPPGSTPPPSDQPGLRRTPTRWRPAYHFSPEAGHLADPNGLVYVPGEEGVAGTFHLFHQHDGSWAHATSTDRWWWHDLPLALVPDESGQALSGSAVVDSHNTSGLVGEAKGRGVAAIFTSTAAGEAQELATSTDGGRTFVRYSGNPVLPPIGTADFRDPKVLWDEERHRWVAVIAVTDHVSLYASDDLRSWTFLSDFGRGRGLQTAVWECPDLFQLLEDGDPARPRWVLHVSVGDSEDTKGSTAQWFLGDFDGTRFSCPDPAGLVRVTDFGQDFYAAQTWFGEPGREPVWLAWMGNWRYPYQTPTLGWQGQMSVPRTLTLETRGGEPMLIQRPLDLAAIADGDAVTLEALDLTDAEPERRVPFDGTAYRLQGVLTWDGAAPPREVGVRVRVSGAKGVAFGVRPVDREVFLDRSTSGTEPLPTRAGGTVAFGRRSAARSSVQPQLPFSVLVDASSVEVFLDDGAHVGTNLVFAPDDATGVSVYAGGGSARAEQLEVTHLRTIWSP